MTVRDSGLYDQQLRGVKVAILNWEDAAEIRVLKGFLRRAPGALLAEGQEQGDYLFDSDVYVVHFMSSLPAGHIAGMLRFSASRR